MFLYTLLIQKALHTKKDANYTRQGYLFEDNFYYEQIQTWKNDFFLSKIPILKFLANKYFIKKLSS